MTIGHSTHTIEEFIGLLQAHGATFVVDVRTVPRSRHNAQFNKESLPQSPRKAGLEYVHASGLGGLRHANRDSANGGWRNASFRGYADYMQTPEFMQSMEELILAAPLRTCRVCRGPRVYSHLRPILLIHKVLLRLFFALVARKTGIMIRCFSIRSNYGRLADHPGAIRPTHF
ncbi:MAG: DUF488 domain-containing protein [Bryobacteraceae bacterium]